MTRVNRRFSQMNKNVFLGAVSLLIGVLILWAAGDVLQRESTDWPENPESGCFGLPF
jgi:hypothetical protein